METSSFVVLDTATGEQVSGLDAIVQAVCAKQVLLVGEFHDDPHAHVVEAELFNMLLSANGYPTSQHKRSFSASNTTPKNSSKAWAGMQAPDVKMGLTGAPNLWTALHDEDPVLQVPQPSIPAAQLPKSPAQQQAAGNPSSAPLQATQLNQSAAEGDNPDCFQSLSGLCPGVMSACCNSSLGTPGGAPSLASAAANAATADAVRPFIRGGYSYMSKSFSNIYGMFTNSQRPSDTAITSPPSFASDLDSLADDTSHHTPVTTPPGPSRRGSPVTAGAPTPPSVLSTTPGFSSHTSSTTESPGSHTTSTSNSSPQAAHASSHTTASAPHTWQPHALPYSTWSIFSSTYTSSAPPQGGAQDTPLASRHSEPHTPLYADSLVDLDNITKSAVRNHEVLSTVGITFGSTLRGLYCTHAYQRSPLSATPHSSGAFTTATSSGSVAAQDSSAPNTETGTPGQSESIAIAVPNAPSDANVGIGMHYGGCWQFPQISPVTAPQMPLHDAQKSNAGPSPEPTSLKSTMHAHSNAQNGMGLSFLAAAMYCRHASTQQPVAPPPTDGTTMTSGGHCGRGISPIPMTTPQSIRRQLYQCSELLLPAVFGGGPARESQCATEHLQSVRPSSPAPWCTTAECKSKHTAPEAHQQSSQEPGCGSHRKDGRAWPNFTQDYLPMVDAAAFAGVPIIAANAPRRYVSLVGRRGLSALPIPTPNTPVATSAATATPEQSRTGHASRTSVAAEPGASTRVAGQFSGVYSCANGLPSAPDAIVPPSAALMAKIRREMMSAQQAAAAEQAVCGTPAPPAPATTSTAPVTIRSTQTTDSPIRAFRDEASKSEASNHTDRNAVRNTSSNAFKSPSDPTPNSAARAEDDAVRGSVKGAPNKGEALTETKAGTQNRAEKECLYSGMRLTDNFFAAQALWDATMTDSILCALNRSACDDACIRDRPSEEHVSGDEIAECEQRGGAVVMHVCGKFHMEEGLGICEHLQSRCPEVAFTTVAITPVDLPRMRCGVEATGGWSVALKRGELSGLPCGVSDLEKMADFVVLTDGTTPRSF